MFIRPLLLSVLTCGIAITANAAPLFQAGNIEEGKKWSINQNTGVASYFAEGTSGQIEFTCDLQGQPDQQNHEVSALLRPGKNFANEYNPFAVPLHAGMNGPFLWTLTDEHEKNGNIKVFYSHGSNVTVQCIGKKR